MKKILFAMFLVLAFLGCSGDESEEKEIIIEGGTITSPATWDGKYLIKESITIDTNITVAKCSVIKVANDATITISDNGSIKSIGTSDCPVKFTSSKATPAKGDWFGFDIYNSSSADSEFVYTIIEYAGNSTYGAVWVQENGHVKLNNTTFSNIEGNGVGFENGAVINEFTANTFKNIEKYPISIYPEQIKSLTPVTTENNGINRVYVEQGDTETAGTWKDLSIPYEANSFLLKSSITIEPNVSLLMVQDAYITIQDQGSLKAIGTLEKPIKFSSAKTVPAKGDWNNIAIYSSSSNDNEFTYVNFEYAGKDNYGAIWVEEEGDVKINNSKFFEIDNVALDFNDDANINSFENNTFENIESYLIRIFPEQVKELAPLTSVNNPKNLIYVRNGDTKTAGTWENLSVNFEFESFYIKGGIITVEAGITLFMSPDSYIQISDGGALKLMGTETEHVTVMSSKAAPAAKDWNNIAIYSSASNDSVFNYTDIRHGGKDGYGQLWLEDQANVELNNVTFSDSDDNCDVDGDVSGITGSTTDYTVCPE